ncbi:MAG: hypothetical protein FDX21_11550 [Chlorobium sp.]|jgi:hypothetical protein|nr:MAG: hypothetical protein FDX21_11550 [Chlorobium sp.]
MSWKDKIPGSFGSVDKKFAGHSLDSERAAELLEAAIKANVGFKKYLAEIENWLKAEGCSAAHIQEEMKKVNDISRYFKQD